MKETIETLKDSDVVVFVPSHLYANTSILYLEKCNRALYTTRDTFYENKDGFVSSLSEDRPLYMMYLWPTYANDDTNEQMMSILKDFEDYGVTTLNDSPKNHGAKLVAGVGGHVLIRLR